MNKLTRTIHPEVRVVDAAKGIVDYVASDQTIDSYREVILAAGWRFTNFVKNAPFVNSHDYSTIENCCGKVIDFRIEKGQLIERVQWAIDVPDNRLAQLGWKMTAGGYLAAVSVGFYPVTYLTPNSQGWKETLAQLGFDENDGVRCVYTQQEQCELSACILGANPNALAKGILNQEDADYLTALNSQRELAPSAIDSGLADWASDRTRKQFVRKMGAIKSPKSKHP